MATDRSAHDDRVEDCGIEVTPEMVRVGAREIVKYHPEFGLPADEAAVNTFRAMANAAGHEIRIPEGVIEAADV
jgi:hypothetical protein